MITIQAPGKLYIAGEYAVVEPGYPAVIVALDQFVTVTIAESREVGSIESKQYQENSLLWRRDGDEMVFDNRDNPFHYILSAIRITEQYALEMGKTLKIFNLKINSELDAQDGRKYGLGSSAAVTVGTIKAISQFYQLNLDKDAIYKLAAIAHLDVQGNGSLGDIAASVYGGWIAYRSFNQDWLRIKRNEATLTALLKMDWPGLSVKMLTPPANLKLLIGWTGSPASTSRLVDKITVATASKPELYQQFLTNSKRCVEQLIVGFETNDLGLIQQQIRANRQILQQLGKMSHVAIETRLLKQMCDIAETHQGAAKTSGAGGGDCGIALVDQTQKAYEAIINAWQAIGVEPLKLKVHQIS
ncbi:phosphomevalonate kinase [Agrilactobacillus fermenti]|uniref:phosphomevalonate kinase n=1 Tax=Agrilactobacillus fermenti TaxID=2586909 RepID=UPI001E486A42|nr:phosphomevalonate kinase [Agrilactobacillus fermenti]MCD2255867.1 phosphomevalonate kinase [Agrilactobacillus fermenti]